MDEQIPTILLFEDDPQFTYLIQRYAGASGCRLIATRSGSEVITLIQQEQPALVMLDMLSSDMNSDQVLSMIKTDPIMCHIPIVLCSSSAPTLYDREEKADGCLLKPIMYDDFIKVLVLTGVIPPPADE